MQAWKARTHLREEGAVEPLDPLLVGSAKQSHLTQPVDLQLHYRAS